jgi:hypothetical protein
MPRLSATATIDEQDLERALLRKGVGALALHRPRCADCGRTPLTGEQQHVFARGEVVCELCRPLRRSSPERTELVRHSEAGHAVRLRARAA